MEAKRQPASSKSHGTGSACARRPNLVRERSLSFAVSIVRIYKQMIRQKEFVISKQLLRSGTSIGANIEEATAAESRRDFQHKVSIASKEARETLYWLRVIDRSDLVSGVDVDWEIDEADQLVRMLTTIVKTLSKCTENQDNRQQTSKR